MKEITDSPAPMNIPIIDISPLVGGHGDPGLVQRTVREIGDACRQVGFFYVKNHQVPQDHLDDVVSVMKDFFDLPEEEKMRIHIGRSDIFRGYTPLGRELTNDKHDWHECVDLGLDLGPDHPEVIAGDRLVGPNQWPEDQPEFKRVLERHWDLTVFLGRRITEGLAMSLGLERSFFAPHMSRSHSFMRLVNYPPYEKNEKESMLNGIGAHADYGFLTILLQDEIGGLEIKNSENEWVSAPIVRGTFLINIGSMIQRWTNDHYKATVHRVIPPEHGNRYSVPFFFEPNFDTVVVPIEKFCSKDNPSRYAPFHFGDHLESTFRTSYSDTMV